MSILRTVETANGLRKTYLEVPALLERAVKDSAKVGWRVHESGKAQRTQQPVDCRHPGVTEAGVNRRDVNSSMRFMRTMLLA
jgi:hypothetical protein